MKCLLSQATYNGSSHNEAFWTRRKSNSYWILPYLSSLFKIS